MSVSTGIAVLDERLGGGVPAGQSLVYLNEPAVDSKVFLYQSFFSALREGLTGIFLTNVKPPNRIRQDFARYGLELDEFGDQLAFIDSYSGLIGTVTDARYVVDNPHEMDSVLATLTTALDENDHAVLGINSLSTVVNYVGEEAFVAHGDRLHRQLQRPTLTLACATDWDFDDLRISEIFRSLDGVVNIQGMEERVVFGQYFTVESAAWLDHISEDRVMYRVAPFKGVQIYVPKLLVTGPFNAGKSTFVKSISTRSVSVERMGTTVALDHGLVEHEGVTAEVFGTPGQARFDHVIRQLARNAMGVVLVVDATKPDDMARAREIIALVDRQGLPLVVAANKQDLPGCMSEAELRERLELPPEVAIIPCRANQPEEALGIFQRLVERITRREANE